MLARLVVAGFAVALPLSGSVSAQETSPVMAADPAIEATVDEEVIVRGQRLGEIEFDLRLYIRDFIERVAAPARSRGFARWHRDVCIGVHNLENTAAQFIVDRISSTALDVGLEPGEPGCNPDVNIIFSTEAGAMAARMVEHEPRVFRPISGDAGMDRGREGLDRFLASEAAVRWWHVSLPVDARTGNPALETPNTTCPRAPHCYPVFFVDGPSRVRSGVRDDLQYVIILVDATKLDGTTWQQLGDYLSFVSLAQIDLDTELAEFDSILNLFSNRAAYSGLTDWDRNYLHALYAFNQERITRMQGNELVSIIARQELSPAE